MKYATTILFSATDDADAAEKAQTMAQEVSGARVQRSTVFDGEGRVSMSSVPEPKRPDFVVLGKVIAMTVAFGPFDGYAAAEEWAVHFFERGEIVPIVAPARIPIAIDKELSR